MTDDFHTTASKQDIISLIGELEHSYRHALRSAATVKDEARATKYAVYANTIRQLRRKVMSQNLDIDEYSWCLCKSTACIRQLSYELFNGDIELLKEIDNLVDEVWSNALGEDISGCEACREDKRAV